MNNKIIVLYSENQNMIADILKYNFKNADLLSIPDSFTPFDREELAKKINDEYEQVYFYDYNNQFYLLIPLISKKVKRKYIINNGISTLNNQYLFSSFMQLLGYKQRKQLDVIASTSYEFTSVFKDIKFIKFDVDMKINTTINNRITIFGFDYDQKSNFYNQLAAVSLTKYKDVNIINKLNVTEKFANTFGLNLNVESNIEKLLENSILSLYISFSDLDAYNFLISMDNKIPCLLGNTNLLDNTKKLKDYLYIQSDDSVYEISHKINETIKNKDNIFKEYNNWRGEYSKESIKLIKEFINL